jgi:hypothetical protein
MNEDGVDEKTHTLNRVSEKRMKHAILGAGAVGGLLRAALRQVRQGIDDWLYVKENKVAALGSGALGRRAPCLRVDCEIFLSTWES